MGDNKLYCMFFPATAARFVEKDSPKHSVSKLAVASWVTNLLHVFRKDRHCKFISLMSLNLYLLVMSWLLSNESSWRTSPAAGSYKHLQPCAPLLSKQIFFFLFGSLNGGATLPWRGWGRKFIFPFVVSKMAKFLENRFVPDCSYTLLTDPSFIPSCISGGISFWTSFSFNQSLRFCKLYAPGPGVWGSLPLNLEDYKVATSGNIRHWTYMGQKVEKANNL